MGVGMDMTPMIDVVFQLIIFFMTVSQQSHLVATELELPRMAGAIDQAPATLTINITHDGRIIVSGEPIGLARLDESIHREIADREEAGRDHHGPPRRSPERQCAGQSGRQPAPGRRSQTEPDRRRGLRTG